MIETPSGYIILHVPCPINVRAVLAKNFVRVDDEKLSMAACHKDTPQSNFTAPERVGATCPCWPYWPSRTAVADDTSWGERPTEAQSSDLSSTTIN